MNEIADFTALLTTLGILALLVSVITQVTKELKFLRKIPTSLQVTVTSIAITEIAYFANASYNKIPIEWYCIAGALVGGFVVAFIAMFGWEKLSDLYGRFRKK